jgi:hypothetical protein
VAGPEKIDQNPLEERESHSGAGFREMGQGLEVAAVHIAKAVKLIAEDKRAPDVSPP